MACPECGTPSVDNIEACEELFHELGLVKFNEPQLAKAWRTVVDCYAMQHDRYIRSGKSLAAHLTGICIATECSGEEGAFSVVQKWLSGRLDVPKLEVPDSRGKVTVDDVLSSSRDDRPRHVRRWAESIWSAWEAHQNQARTWLTQARGVNASPDKSA